MSPTDIENHGGLPSNGRLTRRSFLHAVGAASAGTAASSLLAGCGGGAVSADRSLIFVAWGGTHQENTMSTLLAPWAKKHDVMLRSDAPTNYAKFRTQVQSGNISWGIVQVEPFFAEQACHNGSATKLDYDRIDTSAVDDRFVSPCAIPILQYGFTIAYNTDTFSEENHPRTWQEFFDTKKFPGKRGFWKYATSTTFEAALLADGVPPDDLYPLDIDRALSKLDTIKEDIVWYDTGEQQVQLLSSGEVPLIQAWNGRIYQAAKQGRPVANEWNEHFLSYEQLVVPNGYENAKLAQKWMDWFLGAAKAQAKFAEATAYAAPNRDFMNYIDPEVARELPTYPANEKQRAAVVDYGYYAQHYDEITKRLNTWLAQ